MSYSICERKYLLWTVFDDNDDGDEFISNFKIREFRVCDCFLDWTTRFRNENKNAVFSEEVIADFFDSIPTDTTDCDIFSLFGKITIVCCRKALYHFFIRKMLTMINFTMNVWDMILICVVCIYLRKTCPRFQLFVQIVNLIS